MLTIRPKNVSCFSLETFMCSIHIQFLPGMRILIIEHFKKALEGAKMICLKLNAFLQAKRRKQREITSFIYSAGICILLKWQKKTSTNKNLQYLIIVNTHRRQIRFIHCRSAVQIIWAVAHVDNQFNSASMNSTILHSMFTAHDCSQNTISVNNY